MSDDRPCTCPPMERPHPCARKFALSECERLRDKLQRVRDSLKFAANSPGGLVAEIDDALAQEKRDE